MDMNGAPGKGEGIWKLPVLREIRAKHLEVEAQVKEKLRQKRVDEELRQRGFYEYTRYNIDSIKQPERAEKRRAWSKVLSSPEGLELLRKYDALAEVTPADAPDASTEDAYLEAISKSEDKKNPRIDDYYIKQWMELPHIEDNASLETFEQILRLGIQRRGQLAFEKGRIIEGYLKNDYFTKEAFNVSKLEDLHSIVERADKLAKGVGNQVVVYRIFGEWFEAKGERDISVAAVTKFADELQAYSAELQRVPKENRTQNDDHYWIIEHYLPAMLANDVSPELIDPPELVGFMRGILETAKQSKKVGGFALMHKLVPTLAMMPGMQKDFSLSSVRSVIGDIESIPEVNGGNSHALMGSLYAYVEHANVEGVTAANWKETIGRKYGALASAGGRASRETFDALGALSRLFNFDTEWDQMTTFLSKSIKGSLLDTKALNTIRGLPKESIPLLRTVLKYKPSALVSTLEMLDVAQLFNIDLKEVDYERISPIPNYAQDTLEGLIKRFEGLQRKNGRSEKSRAKGVEPLVDRLRKAVDRNDIAARDQLTLELSQRFGNEYFDYYQSLFNRILSRKARQEFGVKSVVDERITGAVFQKAYKMYQRLTKSRDYNVTHEDIVLAKSLIGSYLEGKTDFIESQPKNVDWLERNLGERASVWLGENERAFEPDAVNLKSNVEKRQDHFLGEARVLLKKLDQGKSGVNIDQFDPEQIVNFFKTLDSAAYSEEELRLYQNLKTQVRGLEQTSADTYGGERPSKIRIMRETDPANALMLGTWVSGSCYDANGMNYWASFPDAMEANKGVFWIKDQGDRILGRVLMAIDKTGKLVTFPVYYAGYAMDLEPIVHEYARDLAKKLGIETNGTARNVEKLLWSSWTSDFEREVAP